VSNLPRNVIQGTAGGALGASCLGVAEAAWLLTSGGAPDLLSPLYAVVLYGGLGAGFGLGGGVALSILERFRPVKTEATPFAFGAVSAITPMGLFIGQYLLNKEVYAEQGVKLPGLIGLLGTIGVLDALLLTVGASILSGGLKGLLKGPGFVGAFGALAAGTGALSFVQPKPAARDTWGHNKPLPKPLADKPNVLLIMVDTLRADHLGTYGKEGNPTPAIDALAKDGVVFENAYAQASWTRASGASLFSGRIPSGHATAVKASRLPSELTLWSEVLHEAGVTTGALINNINLTSTFGFDQGFDTFLYESPAYPFGATESVFGLTFYKVVHKLNERFGGEHRAVETFYQPARTVLADAKGFIEANKDSRWGLFVHLMEPHDPYFEHPVLMGTGDAEYNGVAYGRAEHEKPDPADPKFPVARLKQMYLDEIRFMDRDIDAFLKDLKASGAYDNTMIILTADHGEEFNEHGGFWHGTTLYEEQIHIPLIVKLPKQELAGTRVSWTARSIDVAPTIAAAMGLKAAEGWAGADLIADVRKELDELAAKLTSQAAVDAQAAALNAEIEAMIAGDGSAAAPADPAAAPADPAAAPADPSAAPATPPEAPKPPDPCDAYKNPFSRVVVSEEDFEGNVITSVIKDGFKHIRANEGNPRGLPTDALYDLVVDRPELNNLSASTAQTCGVYNNDRVGVLSEEAKNVITAASATGAKGGKTCVSAEEHERLKALGYIAEGEDANLCP
jgi:arylsulfatase A-like enzyme